MSCVLGNMNEQHSCVNEAIRIVIYHFENSDFNVIQCHCSNLLQLSIISIIEAIHILLYQSFFILQPLYPEFFSGVIGEKHSKHTAVWLFRLQKFDSQVRDS